MTNIPAQIWSPVAVLIVGAVAAIAALVGHLVIRANAKLQGRISRETANQTNVISTENNKTQIALSANLKIADLRQAWINSLRDDMASFQSFGVTLGLDQSEKQEFYRLGTRIELLMNPNDKDYQELTDCLYAFLEAKSTDEKYRANPRYVAVCQRILKREWNVLRDEVKSVTIVPNSPKMTLLES